MFVKALASSSVLFYISFFGHAQLPDCTLGLGSSNTENIVTIFQLNKSQIAVLEELQGKVEVTNKLLEEETKKLFAEHPQSTEAEMIVLAEKYKKLQQKMVDLTKENDTKLLETFNAKQYERYKSLCNEAFRDPIHVIPTVYNDSIAPE